MISHHDVYEGVYQSNAEIHVARGKMAAVKKYVLHYLDALKAERVENQELSTYNVALKGKLKQLETEAKAKKERVKELEDSKYGIRACINVDGRVEDPPADQKKTDATTAEEPLDIDQFDSKLVCNSVVDVSGAATTNRAQE
ncbi:hypothetical protein Bca4012_031915 [Brassica carinata]|nr:unnamed protein product [Brassica napus]